MQPYILLIDHNSARCNERRDGLVAAGVEVISAVEEEQAAEVLKSNRVHVICIDSQFVSKCGSGIGVAIERLKPAVSVVMLGDEAQIPGHFEKYVDVIIGRADFDLTGPWLIHELNHAQHTFFQRWFDDWVNREPESRSGDATPTY